MTVAVIIIAIGAVCFLALVAKVIWDIATYWRGS